MVDDHAGYSDLTEQQRTTLLTGIYPGRVQYKQGMSHLEAWDVKRWLDRIFGIGWDEEYESVMVNERITEKKDGSERYSVTYRAHARITIRSFDGRIIVVKEATAVGHMANLTSYGDAHDFAVKTAESQALKRAVVALGDQFGLSLYNNGSIDPVVIRTSYETTDTVAMADVVMPEIIDQDTDPDHDDDGRQDLSRDVHGLADDENQDTSTSSSVDTQITAPPMSPEEETLIDTILGGTVDEIESAMKTSGDLKNRPAPYGSTDIMKYVIRQTSKTIDGDREPTIDDVARYVWRTLKTAGQINNETTYSYMFSMAMAVKSIIYGIPAMNVRPILDEGHVYNSDVVQSSWIHDESKIIDALKAEYGKDEITIGDLSAIAARHRRDGKNGGTIAGWYKNQR